MVVDDERRGWHEVIVPQVKPLIVLDFPELSPSQGKARRRPALDFLPWRQFSGWKESRRMIGHFVLFIAALVAAATAALGFPSSTASEG